MIVAEDGEEEEEEEEGVDVDLEWLRFLRKSSSSSSSMMSSSRTTTTSTVDMVVVESPLLLHLPPPPPPRCEELRISTITKVLFLNNPSIDVVQTFWRLPVMKYLERAEGILKKQTKIISRTPEEYQTLKNRLESLPFCTLTHIKKQINNPDARTIKFKDESKITVGMSKKDLLCCRGKIKNAFYNCFALFIRVRHGGVFREVHVKVFNTGKMEVPGIVETELLEYVKTKIIELLTPFIVSSSAAAAAAAATPSTTTPPPMEHETAATPPPPPPPLPPSLLLAFRDIDREHNVLINSDFNCGYAINREKLYRLLRRAKYNIETSFDPCNYPGVKSKFYYNNELPADPTVQLGQISPEDWDMKMNQKMKCEKYTEVSFMIFRTGSCLIVGNCTEEILRFVFHFIRTLLAEEYANLCLTPQQQQHQQPGGGGGGGTAAAVKKPKIRKKKIDVSHEYLTQCVLPPPPPPSSMNE